MDKFRQASNFAYLGNLRKFLTFKVDDGAQKIQSIIGIFSIYSFPRQRGK